MSGKVYLLGAGPGDSELLTVKSRRIIDTADVIMYDALIGDEIIESFPATATVLDVGKQPDGAGSRTTQAEINRIMVEQARAGRTVARVKSGDPTVFGRGGEEAEHLADAGVVFEIVPGVSSVVAAPGIAGIPLTHRELASSLTVITGHEDPTKGESAIDWSAIGDTVKAGGTLLILMGVRTLPVNVDRLRAHGVPDETPIALIEKATWETEAIVSGTLDSIVEHAESRVSPPAVTVVGDVVGVRDRVADHLRREGERSVAGIEPLLLSAGSDRSSHPRRPPVLENP